MKNNNKIFVSNGVVQQVNEEWFAYPYTGPALSPINKLGPFDTQADALTALQIR